MLRFVSVIVPSYNSSETIKKCLDSLVLQETDFEYEIVVVDSSNDKTPELIQDYYQVKLVKHGTRIFPGEARNLGVSNSKGEIIAFIDADCVARKDWLINSITSLREGYEIVGGAIDNQNPNSLISIADYLLTFNQYLPIMPKKEVSYHPSCNLICTKDAFISIGGFPPKVKISEDMVFSYIASKKYKILFNPNIVVSHINRNTLNKFLRHHYNFGKHSALVRKSLNLPGYMLSRYPILSFLAPIVRFIRITGRLIRWNNIYIRQFIISLPLIIIGLGAWGFAFITFTFKNQNNSL